MGMPILTKRFLFNTAIELTCLLSYHILLIDMVGISKDFYGTEGVESRLAGGFFIVGAIVSRFFLGKYVEMWGRRNTLVGGLIMALVVTMFYGLMDTLFVVYLLRFLHGISYGLTTTVTTDIAAEIIPKERRGEGLGYFYMSATMGAGLGPFIGLHFVRAGDYMSMLIVVMILQAVALMFAYILDPPEVKLNEEQVKEVKSVKLSSFLQFSVLPMAFVAGLFAFGYNGAVAYVPAYTDFLGISSAAFFFYFSSALGSLASRLTAGRVYDSHGPNYTLLPGYLALLLGIFLFSFVEAPWMLFLSGFVMGFGVTVLSTTFRAMTLSLSPKHRYGATSATFISVYDTGDFIAPYITGLMLLSMPFEEVQWLCGVVVGCSFLLYWFMHGEKHGDVPPPDEDANTG